jgi:membrane-associated phospholipid phosphatase
VTTPPDEPVEARIADRLEASNRVGPTARSVLGQIAEVDRAVYRAIATTPTPSLDDPLRRLSLAANDSRLWLGIATILAVFGGRRGRRAAFRGVVAIGATSAAVNLGAKALAERVRPDRAAWGVPEQRHVPMPATTSFPSGHSASGFAFATAVGRELPALAFPLGFLAGAVAYSRVHTGVHYPGDAVMGSLIGVGSGQVAVSLLDGRERRRARGATTVPLPV